MDDIFSLLIYSLGCGNYLGRNTGIVIIFKGMYDVIIVNIRGIFILVVQLYYFYIISQL